MDITNKAYQIGSWRTPAGQFMPQEDAMATGTLCINTIENVVPLDQQFAVSLKKTVPDELREVLFGQPEATRAEVAAANGDSASVPPMRTYAILDAATVVNLPELLGTSGLEHQCMFKGAAFDDLKDVAPWIVRLEEGNDFTRRLFTGQGGINGLWDSAPGLYLRSRENLVEVQGHFRKFARVKMPEKGWVFFRYYDVVTLQAITRSSESLRNGFFGFMGQLHSLMYRNDSSEQEWVLCQSSDRLRKSRISPESLLMAILDKLKANKTHKDALKLAADVDPANTQTAYQAIMKWLSFGFDSQIQLRTLVDLDRSTGYRFSGQRRVQDIVQQNGASYDAYLKIKRLENE